MSSSGVAEKREAMAIDEFDPDAEQEIPDYRDEAQKLFARLNLGPQGAASKESKATGRYNDLDAVWREPAATAAATAGAVIEINPLRSPPSPRLPVSPSPGTASTAGDAGGVGGGTVYVGNAAAAAGLHVLKAHGITRVVNCTDDLPFYHHQGSSRDLSIEYYRFDLYKMFDRENQTPCRTVEFFGRLFDWIDAAVASGESVLIHCLAGAHRAGTTGVAYVMHKADLRCADAIDVATKARPAIQIFPELEEILGRLETGMALELKAQGI